MGRCLVALSPQRYTNRRTTRLGLCDFACGDDLLAAICLLETGTSAPKSFNDGRCSLSSGWQRRASVGCARIIDFFPGEIDQSERRELLCVPGIERHAFDILLQL